MKILLISGSPHQEGTTSILVKTFTKGAENSGHEVYHFNAGAERGAPVHCLRTVPQRGIGVCVPR